MNVQRIRTTSGRVVAIRYKIEREQAAAIGAGKVAFIPELQAVAFNVKLESGLRVNTFKLKSSQQHGELVARHRAEVWFGDRLAEEWFFAKPTEGKQPIANFVCDYIVAEWKHQSANITPHPAVFVKPATDKTIDPYKQAIEVTLRMLREEYPNTAKAPSPLSFGIDMVRLTGKTSATINLDDAKIVAELSEAAQTHSRRVKRKSLYDEADWFISHPHQWPELCYLSPKTVSARVFDATKIKLSPETISQRISRLNLTTALKRGKR